MTDSPDPDLAETLLAAAAADRERLLRSSDPPSLSSALAALGHRREIAAAEVLALVDQDVEDSRHSAGVWVSVPGEYALQLIREAVDLTREVGGGLPTRYHAFRDLFGEAASPPERALIYETISPLEGNFNRGWLDESPRL